MIFTIPLTIVYFFVYGLLVALPQVDPLPQFVSTSFEWAFGFLYAFDFVLPVDTVLFFLTLSLAFELSVQVWHGVHWVLRKIPMLNVK